MRPAAAALAAALLLRLATDAQERPSVPATPEDKAPRKIEFNRDVRPILSEHCYACHGPDKDKRKAGLRLDQKNSALGRLESGETAVVPGRLNDSALWKRIVHPDEDERMPPFKKTSKRLSKAQIETLRLWIEQGAPWQAHWAYIPPKRPAVPKVGDSTWIRNDIDAFILSRLEREGLKPSPQADPITLVRRANFDLLGLPPAPEEVDAYLADSRSDAWERLVDGLLKNPAYGERMASYWLDLVRYADTIGYHSDNTRNVAPYRDYVVAAFNENMPFDRFTVEQLAGDLVPNGTVRQRVASAYNRLLQTTEEGGAQPKEYRAKYAADRVRNLSSVWLGSTMGCSECHDHKFDPFTTRDFYSLAAFFADVKEADTGRREAGMPVPDEREAAVLQELQTRVAALKKKIETTTPELAAAQAEWEKSAPRQGPWTPLAIDKVSSAGGASVVSHEDQSLLLSGANPPKDTITIEARAVPGITGLRLEALPDKSFPASGPGRSDNGNFVLTGFKVKAGSKAFGLRRATADFSQEGFPIDRAIDGKSGAGWAVLPEVGKAHTAVFETAEPLPGGPVTLSLEFKSIYPAHVIGRLRLSSTTLKDPAAIRAVPGAAAWALRLPPEKRSDSDKVALAAYYRSIAPLLAPARAELEKAEKELAAANARVRTCLVSVPTNPYNMRILPRGNWLNESGDLVSPATPAFLPPLDAPGRRATRLDLAKWLVSSDNPLVARAFVNRLWKLFFGQGISKSLDDLGAQGERPFHPELLDWLAVEFQQDGWDVKRMVKLLLTSNAYRQTSRPTDALKERDPYNRLVARQSRWRLDAEVVRDSALATSGLLSRKVGGESVRPYQPKGYLQYLNFPTRDWKNDSGENEYRRGLYTFWQRTFLHPSLLAFDAPSREECTAERPRSNTPQQALVLLNDPTYVEAARVFAARILKEGGSDPLGWAFRRALSRRPSPAERAVLEGLVQKHRVQYSADLKAAREIMGAGDSTVGVDLEPAQLGAWTSAARAILNLHETISRY